MEKDKKRETAKLINLIRFIPRACGTKNQEWINHGSGVGHEWASLPQRWHPLQKDRYNFNENKIHRSRFPVPSQQENTSALPTCTLNK